MEREIVYTKKAIEEIRKDWAYLEENASSQAAQNLLENIVVLESRLAKYPESGHPSSAVDKNIRYLKVQKHKILFYRYTTKTITVLALFDTRQDPKKRPY